MSVHQTPRSKASTKWSVIVLTLVFVGALGASALIYAQRTKAKGTAPDGSPESRVLSQIASILKDESKDAQQRIDEAMKIVEKSESQNEAPLVEPDRDPLGWVDPWGTWSAPFQRRTWSPFREMQEMRRNMDRQFDDALRRMDEGPSLRVDEPLRWSPQGEFEERDDAYVYRFDVPGVDKGEINVTLEGGYLTIEGHRESRIEEKNKDEGLLRREISHGQFRRSIALPSDVDANGAVQSKLDNGVLTITLPKLKGVPKSEPKRIEIQ